VADESTNQVDALGICPRGGGGDASSLVHHRRVCAFAWRHGDLCGSGYARTGTPGSPPSMGRL